MLRVIALPPPRIMVDGSNITFGYSQPAFNKVPYASSHRPEQCCLSPQTISYVFKSSTKLFLTRRLPEALVALQPVVTDPTSSIRHCHRALRIKIWRLYLAILDAIAKTGAYEGKATWGLKEWPKLVGMIRCGTVWDEVIRSYGDEGRVDPEVVLTL